MMLLAINMTALYISFGVIFGVLILATVALGSMHGVVAKQRHDHRAAKATPPAPIEIKSEDLTIRIRDGRMEAYDTPEYEAPAEVPAEEPQPEAEVAAEEPVEQAEEEPDGVLIPRTEKLTFREKYERLPDADKRLLDEFTAYVTEKADCSKLLQTSALAFRYKKGQIAKAVIRRESVYLNFSILNPELGRMVREERTSGLKMKPVEIRLLDEEDLNIAKQTADLTVEYLAQEEEYRNEKRKEARREAARQRREEAAIGRD